MSSLLISRLLSSPPALRSDLVRRAIAAGPAQSEERHLWTAARALKGASLAQRRPQNQHISLLTRRFASTTAASTTPSSTATTTPPPPSPDAPPTPKPPHSRTRRYLTSTLLALTLFVTGLTMSAAPAADTLNGFAAPPTDLETLSLYEPLTPAAAAIDAAIKSHPLATALRAQDNTVESRPHLKIPAAMRPHNLTGGTLLGADKIEVPPLNFASTTDELPTLQQIAYLGPALCGHPGVVHGGLLATLLDEGLARCCFPALPNKVGVTASLKIDYRAPCPAGRYVVLRAETTKVEGRKAWVKGWIELLPNEGEEGYEAGKGVKCVEAEALFIEPKGAAGMARVYSSQ